MEANSINSTAVIGLSLCCAKVSIFWGTPSSRTLKFSTLSPGINCPLLVTTFTGRFTKGTFTFRENVPISSGFFTLGARSTGFSSSGFFLGTAIGPKSPEGPPASAGACGCEPWLWVELWEFWEFCAAEIANATPNRPTMTVLRSHVRRTLVPLRDIFGAFLLTLLRIVLLSLCISIDAEPPGKHLGRRMFGPCGPSVPPF